MTMQHDLAQIQPMFLPIRQSFAHLYAVSNQRLRAARKGR